MPNKHRISLKFTGERLIPEKNKDQAFFYEHLIRYLFASQLAKNKVILDMGCGVGYGSFILKQYGNAKKVYGVDNSEEAIEYANFKYKSNNIYYKIDHVEKLKYLKDGSIDLAVGFEIIEHIYNQKKFLEQIKRVMQKNGIVFISTPNKYTYPKGNPYHKRELYPQQFFALLKKFFKNVEIYYQNFEIAQIIKPDQPINFVFEKNFNSLNQITYTPPADKKKSQFLLAACSDIILPRLKLMSINSYKIDNIDISYGLLKLEEEIGSLEKESALLKYKLNSERAKKKMLNNQKKTLNNQIKNLSNDLEKIQSSKFYKLWQFYCNVRDSVFKNK